jgi:DNA-binding XRE family transcriptional regulator
MGQFVLCSREMGLRELREERALSQQDLANAAGVSKTTIVNLEAGRGRAMPSTVRKLAAALDVDVRELVRILRSPEPQG